MLGIFGSELLLSSRCYKGKTLSYNAISMIQIQPHQDVQTPTPNSSLPGPPHILRRVVYTLVLAFICLHLTLYFELTDNYDLLSMMLGFLVCIILQFTLLSLYFKEQRHELNMDEIGVINYKIRQMFGEEDPRERHKKNKKKFYHRQLSEQDKLFEDNNDGLYQNVMTYLRGKEELNFNELINRVKGRWFSLESKIQVVEGLLQGILKLEEQKKKVHTKYKNKMKRINDMNQYLEWVNFLQEKTQQEHVNALQMTKYQSFCLNNNTSYLSVQQDAETPTANPINIDPLRNTIVNKLLETHLYNNWGIINGLLLDKIRIAEKNVADLKDRVIGEFSSYATTIRNSCATYAKKRQILHTEYKLAMIEKDKNIEELAKTAREIANLSENKLEGAQIEKILEQEFKLRLLKIESENFMIKLAKAKSNALASGEQLFHAIQEENKQLEHYLFIMNRKINQYLHEMAGFGQQKAPHVNKHLREAAQRPTDQDSLFPFTLDTTDTEQLFNRMMVRRRRQQQFRKYIECLIQLYDELKIQQAKAKTIIRQLKYNIEKSQEGDKMGKNRVVYFASTVNDHKLIRLFEQMTRIQEVHSQKMRKVLAQQLAITKNFETTLSNPFNSNLKMRFDQYKRKDEELKRSKVRASKGQSGAVQRSSLVNGEVESCRKRVEILIMEYAESNKIGSTLPELIAIMAQLQSEYGQLAGEIDNEEVNEQNLRTNDQQQRRKQKYAAFSKLLYRKNSQTYLDEQLASKYPYAEYESPVDEPRTKYLIELDELAKIDEKEENQTKKKNSRYNDFFKYRANPIDSLSMVNRVLCVLFNQWSRSQNFHEVIKEELLVSLNRKRPDIVEHLRIDFFRIIEREKDLIPIENLKVHPSEIYRCMFDFYLNFRGKIAVKIGSRFKIGNKPDLTVKLFIKQFKVPIRLCFTPFTLGKSYASLLDKPKITIDYNVKVGKLQLTKIPLFTWFIKTYAAIKLRKKFLWPKRITLNLPLSFKSPLELAVEQKKQFQEEQQRLRKKSK